VLNGFHPLRAGAGDVLVLDGARFWSGLFPSAKVRVGGVDVTPHKPLLDSTRLLAPLPKALSGVVQVITGGGKTLTVAGAIKAAPAGALPCDGSTPGATGKAGASPASAGPHGAGYLDLSGTTVARLFYPAKCGGVRRPAKKGTWPLVLIMHGNGAGYLHYEYLGQLLATWGILALLPDAQVDYKAKDIVKISAAQVATLRAAIKVARAKDLKSASTVLAGVRASGKVAWVGHSRGTARIQAVQAADATLKAATVATVFLGPVDDGKVVPGSFLVVAGTHDSQSPAYIYNPTYARQKKPRYRVVIKGGNHSLFTDHKVWSGFLDQKPTVSRAAQQGVVATFALPLLQRAFGQAQPFAKIMDSPPASATYTVTYQK